MKFCFCFKNIENFADKICSVQKFYRAIICCKKLNYTFTSFRHIRMYSLSCASCFSGKGRTDAEPDLLVDVYDFLMLGLARAYHTTSSN